MDVIVRTAIAHGPTLALLDVASLPEKPVHPKRLIIVIMGLIVGLTLGLLILAVRRRRLIRAK
jgi:LPS O-antigen subunit length determinant protein (WzzB/FepE family)